MLQITDSISLADDEIDMQAIRASGAGGQHVNKVSSAIHLRFDIQASSLPEHCKERLFNVRDRRINRAGVIIIKAQQFRSQDHNKMDALNRLQELIRTAIIVPKRRRPTRQPRASIKRRLESKNKRSHLKKLRKNTYD